MHLRTSTRRTRAAWIFGHRLWIRWLLPGRGVWSRQCGGSGLGAFRQVNFGRLSFTWFSER